MSITITLPSMKQTRDEILARWDELAWNDQLAALEGRVEMTETGQYLVSPPPTLDHRNRQYLILRLLEDLLGQHPRCWMPVLTAGGVRSVDVAWFSSERFDQSTGTTVCEIAPEICVEVLSPSNSEHEMELKRQLSFDAGAEECWQCDVEGRMSFYIDGDADTAVRRSPRCPNFPARP